MSRTAWEVVQQARDLERPTAQYFIRNIFTDFVEMHGDKLFADDAAIIGGVGFLDDVPVTVIGQEKGVSLSEKARCNFGSAHPEGYRKSLRLMKQAEKFSRPIICIVDTQGAFCGVGAEERGMAEAIARNLLEMSRLRTPVVSVLIGEGGSGGAIALAVSDRLAMLENSVYSILSPEGFSSILWKEAARAPEAAELMRMTAREVRDMGIVDDVVPEPPEGAKASDRGAMARRVKQYLTGAVSSLRSMPIDVLLERRYEKFRSFGRDFVTLSPRAKEGEKDPLVSGGRAEEKASEDATEPRAQSAPAGVSADGTREDSATEAVPPAPAQESRPQSETAAQEKTPEPSSAEDRSQSAASSSPDGTKKPAAKPPRSKKSRQGTKKAASSKPKTAGSPQKKRDIAKG